ncbi:MAG: cytochrome P450 [Sphingomonadaceae bacterium]|nr:cytochrome P450 [Sphingomonadaceae bacterium]
MIPAVAISLTEPAFKADPFPTYVRMRAETPICRIATSRNGSAIFVTRYADVSALLRDKRFVKDPANALTSEQLAQQRRIPGLLSPLTRNILALDDPDHARLRRLVQAVFTPRRIDALEAQVVAASAALLEPLHKQSSFDLIADYALPLPVKVISDLLGVPTADQTRFARWSHALIKVGSVSPINAILQMPAVLSFLRYLKRLIAMKRKDPADDLISALVAQQQDDVLSEHELMAMISILLSAGHETTTNLIGNGMLTLMRHPAARESLLTAPALIEPAIEEFLRFEGPVEMSTPRYASDDVALGDVTIPQGSTVFGIIASANRDDRNFVNADRVLIERDPNRHLTFGEGGHYCLGASLARMEGRVAFAHLLDRFPNMHMRHPASSHRWRPNMVLRGIERFPVICA